MRNWLRMCLDTCEKTDVEKYRNLRQNREVLSPSVPSLYWHKSFAPYQAGCVCLPSPSTLLKCAKPAHRDRRQEHALREVMPRGKKVEKR